MEEKEEELGMEKELGYGGGGGGVENGEGTWV